MKIIGKTKKTLGKAWNILKSKIVLTKRQADEVTHVGPGLLHLKILTFEGGMKSPGLEVDRSAEPFCGLKWKFELKSVLDICNNEMFEG